MKDQSFGKSLSSGLNPELSKKEEVEKKISNLIFPTMSLGAVMGGAAGNLASHLMKRNQLAGGSIGTLIGAPAGFLLGAKMNERDLDRLGNFFSRAEKNDI